VHVGALDCGDLRTAVSTTMDLLSTVADVAVEGDCIRCEEDGSGDEQ
jgi:hypothetical protein